MNTKNEIAASAHFIGDIVIGVGNFIGPGATIIGPITIGNNNYFGPNCVVGTPPQDDLFDFQNHCNATIGNRSPQYGIEIGNNNVVREFVTIHQGLTTKTIIKNNCYLMSYSHIAHDCYIDEKVKIANNVQMGGYTTILHDSYIGLSAVLHQFTTIGSFVMVGMGAVVPKNIPPALLALGAPARILKINNVAMQKIGISEASWESTYTKSPTYSNIHIFLQEDFKQFEEIVANKHQQRKDVSAIREGKK